MILISQNGLYSMSFYRYYEPKLSISMTAPSIYHVVITLFENPLLSYKMGCYTTLGRAQREIDCVEEYYNSGGHNKDYIYRMGADNG